MKEMGCKPSKNTSTVHPSKANKTSSKNEIVHVQESPDAPSSTPEHSPTNNQGSPPAQPSSGASAIPLATELQKRLESHANSTQSSSNRSRPRLLRQSEIMASEDIDYVDGASDGFSGDIDMSEDVSAHLSQVEYSYRRPEKSDQSIIQPAATYPVPFTAASYTTDGVMLRSQPPSPFIHANPQLKCRFATDSQIEFFKMLDKKIEEGPDYVDDR